MARKSNRFRFLEFNLICGQFVTVKSIFRINIKLWIFVYPFKNFSRQLLIIKKYVINNKHILSARWQYQNVFEDYRWTGSYYILQLCLYVPREIALPFIETFKRKGQVIVLGSILAILLQSVKKQDKQQQQN